MIGEDDTQPAHGPASDPGVPDDARDQSLSRYVLGDALERIPGDATYEARDPALARDVVIRVIKAVQPDGSAELLVSVVAWIRGNADRVTAAKNWRWPEPVARTLGP
jgi:hypothetical protein